MKDQVSCPLCDCPNINNPFFEKSDVFCSCAKVDSVPNESFIHASISFVQCKDCGFVFNNSFNQEKINEEYKSQSYCLKKIVSPNMSKNLEFIKNKIISHCSTDMELMEIGSGDGVLSCALATNFHKIYSVDPSIESIKANNIPNIFHINDFYSYEKTKNTVGKVDIIIFRHLLEHIANPKTFLKDISLSLKDNGLLYIEVPNFQEIFESNRFYDIFHDHFGYFSEEVLVNALYNLGFKLIDSFRLFNDQHLGLFFQKSNDIKGLLYRNAPPPPRTSQIQFLPVQPKSKLN
jgi:SAM-dependent methyltransferase